MPLPDERPRGSVANLIGRFEQQTKRHPQGSPRSASVLSQHTGESVKEEPKDKREWPPKSITTNTDQPSSTVVSPPWLRRSSPPEPVLELEPQPETDTRLIAQPTDVVELPEQIITLPTQPIEPEVSITAPTPTTTTVPVELAPEPEPEPEPIPIPEVPKEVPIPVPELSPIVAPAASPEPVPTPTPPKTPPPPIVQPITPPSTRTPPRATGKPSIKSPARPTASQPLRPQHTGGASTTSTSGAAKKTTSRTAPTTPSRPKTPAARPSAGGATVIPPRPKTPVIRPKTPSSSLFAPTAASLARSRSSQQPPLPGPVKKTPSAADRLSKPTASSLSKTRAPPVPPIPSNATTTTRSTATVTAHSARGGTTARGTSRVTSSSIRVKKEPTKGKTAADAKAKITTADAVTVASVHGTEGANGDHSDPGHVSEVDVAHLSGQDHDLSHASSDAGEHSDLSPQQDSFGSTLVSGPEGKMDGPTINVTSNEGTTTSGPRPDQNGGGKPTASEDELEQIVNLLEKPGRPISYILPEEIHEIPDEE